MLNRLKEIKDSYGNSWVIIEVPDLKTSAGVTFVYLEINGVMATMPMPKNLFRLMLSATFFNSLRTQIANI